MRINQLKILNFKNYNQATVRFNAKINLIYGQNGSGKTNLLDCIHYIALAKSYFGLSDTQIVKHNEEILRVEGAIMNDDDKINSMVIKYRAGSRKEIEFKKQKLNSNSEIVGLLPLVFVAPNDIKLVNDGSKDRRDFANRILCQSDKSYLSALLQYNRILAQKNSYLKAEQSIDHLLLESYNDKLIALGSIIFHHRQQFVIDFLPNLVSNYKAISSGSESVSIRYRSQYDVTNVKDAYAKLYSQEIQYKRPLIGIHKDDFEFEISNHELKKYGSQGQIKTFLYALRIAEFNFLKEKLVVKPILILDDFFEKLDRLRLNQLIHLINNDTFDQIFLSDTELERSKKIFEENDINFSAFHISEGSIIDIIN